jgi:hypothetical protein
MPRDLRGGRRLPGGQRAPRAGRGHRSARARALPRDEPRRRRGRHDRLPRRARPTAPTCWSRSTATARWTRPSCRTSSPRSSTATPTTPRATASTTSRTSARMPVARIVGNAALSFISKFSSGYWDLFDPTNGYTAIHAVGGASCCRSIGISRRYFFETDMLFRLNTSRAVVRDVPMDARYGDERSILALAHPREFGALQARADRQAAVLQLLPARLLRWPRSNWSWACMLLVRRHGFGLCSGSSGWLARHHRVRPARSCWPRCPRSSALQLLLAFLSFDVSRVPRRPLHPQLRHWRGTRRRLEAPPGMA